MCLSAIVGLGSSLIGASSASKAAKAQKQSADAQLALQERIYDENVGRFDPYYQSGLQNLEVLNYLNGIGGQPTFGGDPLSIETVNTPNQSPGYSGGGKMMDFMGGGSQGNTTSYRVGDQTFDSMDAAQSYANANRTGGTPYAGMQETDAYKFRVDQGIKAIDASAAARGGLYSGKTLLDAQRHGIGQANQFENDYYNRIAGQAQAGQAAAGQQAQAGQNYATGGSNALAAAGNAASAGAIGVGNALQNGIQNGVGLYQYQQGLNGNQNALSGGNSWWGGGFGPI
ncbi:hypothetical protein [Sulfitobacter sp. 20_GPM-1509m]|uniref:hypothetical protein n=1 Tax=Sulfitobacter sp. 20_GPM-1509m TaxID=1380367 RepID=UPI000685D993|nr:hypothetical protein [Sulfitobacter sp. 20_GPM-1509m]